MWEARYVARKLSLLRWGVWDTASDRWVVNWTDSFPIAQGVAEHRADYMNLSTSGC